MATTNLLILVIDPTDEQRMKIDDFLSDHVTEFTYVMQPDNPISHDSMMAHDQRSTVNNMIELALKRISDTATDAGYRNILGSVGEIKRWLKEL